MEAPQRVTLALVVGLLVLCGGGYALVIGLEMEVMQEIRADEGTRAEEVWTRMVQELGCDAMKGEEGCLVRLGNLLTVAARTNPLVLALWVKDPDNKIVAFYEKEGYSGDHGSCAEQAGPWAKFNHEHGKGKLQRTPVGCTAIPLLTDGRLTGAVLIHTDRPWARSGQLAGAAVRRTAWRLLPPFLLFYALLGALLLACARAARKWRLRAEAFARNRAFGNLAVGLGHEIRNPLNSVSLSCEYLARKTEDEAAKEQLSRLRQDTKRIGDAIDRLMMYSNPPCPVLARGSVGMLLRDVVAREGGHDAIDIDGDVEIFMDRARLSAAFRDLVRFILEVRPTRRRARVRLHARRRKWGLEVTLPEPKLEPGSESQLFDPFLQPRPHDVARGLALMRAVLQGYGGDLKARRIDGNLIIEGRAPLAPAPEGVK